MSDLQQRMALFQKCVEDRDLQLVDQVLDADYALILVQPARTVVPRQQWLEVLSDYIIHSYEVEEQVLDVDGDCAIVLHRVNMTATVLGKDRSGKFVVSDLWRIRNGEWRIWRRHSTPLGAGLLPDAGSPGAGARQSEVGAGKKGVVLLSGGNPQIAKGDGDAPVQAYIAAMPGWKHDLGKRLDEIIVRNVPGVRKAVKWNSPFYGMEGRGWFLSFHVFTRYVKVTFFSGTSLRPVPPGGTERSKDARWIDIHEGDGLDEEQMAAWVKQAAALPGWIP